MFYFNRIIFKFLSYKDSLAWSYFGCSKQWFFFFAGENVFRVLTNIYSREAAF